MKRSSPKVRIPAPNPVVVEAAPLTSLADQAYEQLRAALMEGVFQPGESIVLTAIADQIGTSVQPVREAVMKLAAENAFELSSGRSARVPELDGRRFMELCDVRILLESRAAQLAAKRATRDDLISIEKAHKQMQRAVRDRDTDTALRFNREFHFAIYRAAHQELLASCIERLWLQCGPYFRAVFSSMTSPKAPRRDTTGHHSEALNAIRDKNPRRASAAISHDIAESAAWYRSSHQLNEENATGTATKTRESVKSRL